MRHVKAWLALGLIFASLAASGAANAAGKKKTKPPPPIPTDEALGFFDNTRDEFLTNIKRVGVMPIIDMPVSLREREDARQLVTEAVVKHLRMANIDVVGSGTYQATFDRFNQQLGGIYDGKTGLRKRDVFTAVYQNARREFASKERLDAFVHIRVVMNSASYGYDWAQWDGVRERSDGKPPPSNAFAEFWSATDSQGKLPGLSILLQIVSKQDRVLYGRHGGIQLAAYHDWVKGSNVAFVQVPPEELLKDLERLDRAARVATLPLLRTPQDISLGDQDPMINATRVDISKLPPLPAGKPFKDDSPLLVPRDQILQSVHRIALTPINTDVFEVPEDVQQRLIAAIKQELAPLNWEIVDAPRAREMLLEGLLKVELYDKFTGKRDDSQASAIRKSVFNSLGITPAPDAIMWVGFVKTGAIHRWGDVEWDGVSQSGISLGPVVKKMFGGSADLNAGSGGIDAVSLNTYLADANDTPLYRGRGGLQLIQRLKVIPATYTSGGRGEPVDLAPSELFREQAREQPAVHAALRELVMTPEALALELNPPKDSKKTRKKKA
ncbi:MAG TPA: hypothetical protein VFO82_03935 [Steroidobacteraceae bacterium]|nr:hypothetical protein [Steroidobacteraceae bacterium]